MDEAKLVGGTAEDHRRLLERMDEYLDVNARFDWEQLQDIWSGAPEAVFFNLNGHTYKGREHWTRLWQYYKDNVASGYWTPFDIGGVVNSDLAVIWCERQTRSEWKSARTRCRHVPMARISSRARPWCSARKTAIGASFMCISRPPAKRRAPAAYDAAWTASAKLASGCRARSTHGAALNWRGRRIMRGSPRRGSPRTRFSAASWRPPALAPRRRAACVSGSAWSIPTAGIRR